MPFIQPTCAAQGPTSLGVVHGLFYYQEASSPCYDSTVNVRKLFGDAAASMAAKFEESTAFTHQGAKGSNREEILRAFLRERVPERFGIARGQIVGPDSPDSRESDVILYDKNICAPILPSRDAQIFPVEGVSGIIEVKSTLTKNELIDGLGKIADFKKLVPKSYVRWRNAGMSGSRLREHPFGVIFAYQLGGNSLESLAANLREYESSLQDPGLTANIIVVLNEGLIVHKNRHIYRDVLVTDALREQPYRTLPLKYSTATLFEFYTMLLDLLMNTQLDVVELSRYSPPVERLGTHIVRKHDRMSRRGDPGRYRLTAEFIDGVVQWCGTQPKLSSNELNRMIMPDHPDLRARFAGDGPKVIYLYNPDGLPAPTMEMLNNAEDGLVKEPCLVGTFFIEINGEEYAIPPIYTARNTELIPGATWDDP
jgi:hypothetical protein